MGGGVKGFIEQASGQVVVGQEWGRGRERCFFSPTLPLRFTNRVLSLPTSRTMWSFKKVALRTQWGPPFCL